MGVMGVKHMSRYLPGRAAQEQDRQVDIQTFGTTRLRRAEYGDATPATGAESTARRERMSRFTYGTEGTR